MGIRGRGGGGGGGRGRGRGSATLTLTLNLTLTLTLSLTLTPTLPKVSAAAHLVVSARYQPADIPNASAQLKADPHVLKVRVRVKGQG